jgi:hypothetical protein
MGSKNNQLMSPPISKRNPPTLPDHQNPEINGRELAIRAIKNDKADMDSSINPSWRRLMFMVRLVA